MSEAIQTELPDDEIERIQQVIKEFFIQGYDELFETRIQKLIFFTEVYCIYHYRMRMTQASYKPYMYGAYSRPISDALEGINDAVHRRKVVRNGNRTVIYSLEDESVDSGLPEPLKTIISRVYDETRGKSTDNLAQFSKDSWLFKKTEYNHPMDFEEFAEALDENPEAAQKLGSQLPQEVDGAEEYLRPLRADSESSMELAG